MICFNNNIEDVVKTLEINLRENVIVLVRSWQDSYYIYEQLHHRIIRYLSDDTFQKSRKMRNGTCYIRNISIIPYDLIRDTSKIKGLRSENIIVFRSDEYEDQHKLMTILVGLLA